MGKEKWIYIPATNEKKIPSHPKVLTFKTSEGKYVSIKDLPEEVLNNAIEFIEALGELEILHKTAIWADDESGVASFSMSGFGFHWVGGEILQNLYITADNHLVGRLQKHLTNNE